MGESLCPAAHQREDPIEGGHGLEPVTEAVVDAHAAFQFFRVTIWEISDRHIPYIFANLR